jgi:8-oxo-dGTP pyrophosphatase MutT (NUDIX family)
MYKIYINQSLLILCSLEVFREMDKGRIALSLSYSGDKKRLHNVIDLLEKSSKNQRSVIYTTDLSRLWNDFKSINQYKKAAGGVVFNELGELLVIYRRGHWDLPKGHIDPGEKTRKAAIREVEEECGVRKLQIVKKLGRTYHIYRVRGRKVLKKSVWYHMTTKKQDPVPQVKEAIEQANWVNPRIFLDEYDMYPSIRSILEFFFKIVN